MAKQPKKYTASTAVYVDGVLHKAGETFVTDAPKGDTWTEAKGSEAVVAAVADAQKEIPDDVNLEALSASELRAHAASLGINLGDVKSKQDIITVIKAHDEPTL